VEKRRTGQVARGGRWIERELAQESTARGVCARNALELFDVLNPCLGARVASLEDGLTEAAHPGDLGGRWEIARAAVDKYIAQRCEPFARSRGQARWIRNQAFDWRDGQPSTIDMPILRLKRTRNAHLLHSIAASPVPRQRFMLSRNGHS